MPISSTGTITPPLDSQTAYTVPFNAVIDNVNGVVGNSAAFTAPPGNSVRPYILLYTAPPGSSTFTPIAAAKVSPTSGYSGTTPALTTLPITLNGIGATVPAGTRILIAGQTETAGASPIAAGYYFYYNGGIEMHRA
jgi:hypothetical protein